MNFARHSISATEHITILDAQLEPDCQIFTTCTPAGFAVYQASPLKLLRKRGMFFRYCVTVL
jgi:WD repeat-containing protein 45